MSPPAARGIFGEVPRKRIRAIAGPLAGADFTLSDRTVLGRAGDSEVQLLTRGVSRHHAVITCDGEHPVLRDLTSTNGTLVNGARVSQRDLQPGDVIQIDTHELVYELTDEPAQEDPEELVNVLSGPAEEITRLMDTPKEILAIRSTWPPANDG